MILPLEPVKPLASGVTHYRKVTERLIKYLEYWDYLDKQDLEVLEHNLRLWIKSLSRKELASLWLRDYPSLAAWREAILRRWIVEYEKDQEEGIEREKKMLDRELSREKFNHGL